MEAHKLVYNKEKRVGNMLYVAHVSLNDDCKNGHIDFHCTGDVYEIAPDGRKVWSSGGCCHDMILKRFPEFKCFVDLHLSNCEGTPMYAVANGFYFLRNGKRDALMNLLRISADEYDFISRHTCDETHFTYLIITMGLPKRWKEEAEAAIKELEKLTGKKFVDNSTKLYKIEIAPEEMYEMQNRVSTGYYSLENIEKRKKEEMDAAKQALIKELVEKCETGKAKYDRELTVQLYIINYGLSIDNFIYYDHTRTGVFNWMGHRNHISVEEFEKFIQSLDKTALPDGIKFELKR